MDLTVLRSRNALSALETQQLSHNTVAEQQKIVWHSPTIDLTSGVQQTHVASLMHKQKSQYAAVSRKDLDVRKPTQCS